MSTRLISYCGIRWEVLEKPRLKAARETDVTSKALYFLSRAGSRRSDSVPSDWEHLAEKDLATLCAHARPLHEHAVFAGVLDSSDGSDAASP